MLVHPNLCSRKQDICLTVVALLFCGCVALRRHHLHRLDLMRTTSNVRLSASALVHATTFSGPELDGRTGEPGRRVTGPRLAQCTMHNAFGNTAHLLLICKSARKRDRPLASAPMFLGGDDWATGISRWRLSCGSPEGAAGMRASVRLRTPPIVSVPSRSVPADLRGLLTTKLSVQCAAMQTF